MAYCNSHARRDFKGIDAPEAQYMVDEYKKIYRINAACKGLYPEECLSLRSQMTPHFEAMKAHCRQHIDSFSDKSVLGKAFAYFLKYFAELTLFLTNPLIPIDNNASERLLRSHVVGRKTWYGTHHSPERAQVAAIHFTLVESCSDFMRDVNSQLARFINTWFERDSQAIRERYKSPLIEGLRYLHIVMNYVWFNRHKLIGSTPKTDPYCPLYWRLNPDAAHRFSKDPKIRSLMA